MDNKITHTTTLEGFYGILDSGFISPRNKTGVDPFFRQILTLRVKIMCILESII